MEAARREMLTAVHAEMDSFPESGRRHVEMDIAAGGECVYEEKLVMLLIQRLHYPEYTVREAVRVIVQNGWEVPEGAQNRLRTGKTISAAYFRTGQGVLV